MVNEPSRHVSYFRVYVGLLLFLICASVMTIDYNVARIARAMIGDSAGTSVVDDLFGTRGMATFAHPRQTPYGMSLWLWIVGCGVVGFVVGVVRDIQRRRCARSQS